METLVQDLRYAVRKLLRSPGFTTAAVLSLALGIGANATIYTWVSAVLVHPISGVAEPERLVTLSVADPREDFISLSYLDYTDYRDSGAVQGLIAQDELALGLAADGRADRIWSLMVSENYFDVLGVEAALGRTFHADDGGRPGAAPYVVLSHGLWKRRFGSDPGVVGRGVSLNAQPFTVMGVTPPEFRGSVVGLSMDAYVPLSMQPALAGGVDRLQQRGNRWLQGVARLRPDQEIGEAQARLQAVSRQLHENGHGPDTALAALHTFWNTPSGGTRVLRPVLSILMAVVAMVLLIACANVASLLLARATERRREVAVRLSLGAGRARLVRQLLTESLLLSSLGGFLGVVLAFWGTGILMAFAPATDLPVSLEPRVDAGALLFTLALSMVTGVLFGLAPALQATHPRLANVLRDEAGSVAGSRGRSRLRGALVAAQVGLSVVLLVAAGLLLRSLHATRTADPGFRSEGVLLASLDLLSGGYDAPRGTAFWRELWTRTRALPGVQSVSLARRAPLGLGGSSSSSLRVEGYTPPADEFAWAFYHPVGPDYFRTMGTPLVRGRDIAEADVADAPRVAVVSEEMARRYWGDRDPIGGRIKYRDQWWTVVGVARESKHKTLNERPGPHLFVPVLQAYQPGMTLLVRAAGDPSAEAPLVRAQVRSLDPALPILDVRTLAEHVQASSFAQRLGGSLLAGFGAVALGLAVLGLYGVLAYTVGQRTREIGIRMALGGRARDIFRMVLQQGLRVALAGMAVGVLAALAGSCALASLLIGVSPQDPLTFLGVAAVLTCASVAACLIPARRATRVDPAIALRTE